MDSDFEPYIPADRDIPEFTLKAILVGIAITIIMGAANAYLGLFVGMTVSATIPSLVFSLFLLKLFRGSILEINMSKNIGVAGEALAAGIIFTFPAMVVIATLTGGGGGWEDMLTFKNLGIMVLIALVGGLLGILFTIPLRKVFIEDLDLPYPEGVAAAEVLKAMEKGGRGIYYIMLAAGIGGFMKFASQSGLSLWKEKIEGVVGAGKVRFFGGVNVSPALLGVGYIIGPKISLIVFSGGIIGWVIAIPLIGMIKGWPTTDFTGAVISGNWVEQVYEVWFSETKWIGIGAVLTGGTYTLWSMKGTLVQSIKQTLSGGKSKDKGEPAPIRTERDFTVSPIYLGIIFVVVVGIYLFITREVQTSIILAVVMFLATFLFTAVAGYLAGIVGSSNNPISSVTITTLVFTAFVLLGMGAIHFSSLGMNMAMGATILVAAVVCCSAAIAGDSMQELKTAQILGATPIRIQWGRFIGVVVGALFIPVIVAMLAKAYGIGSPELPSPQAVIMGSTVFAIFEGDFNYLMFGIGVLVAAFLIWRKLPVMAVAIGIYLPFTLTTPIFLGGIMGFFSERFVVRKTKMFDAKGLSDEETEEKVKEAKEDTFNKGLLFAAGLVAGEAVLGVLVALIIIVGGPGAIAVFSDPSVIPGIFALLYVMGLIIYMVIREPLSQISRSQASTVFRTMFRK